MIRMCRMMGESEKLRSYKLDHESKMRLLKTHSKTSQRPGYEARKWRRKTVEGRADRTTRQITHPKSAAYRRCGGGGKTEMALPQTNHKGTMARQTLVKVKGNTSTNTRETSCHKPPADVWHGGELDDETTNTWNRRCHHLQPARARRV